MENNEATPRRKKMPPIIFLAVILMTVAIGIYLLHSVPDKEPVIKDNQTANNSIQEKIIVCDHDRVCDAGENSADCPGDCILSTGLSAARSNVSNKTDITPTVTVRMQDPDGIKSCGNSPTDELQWDCVVKEPGAIVTDVDCTLKNYVLDGRYMLVLRCKNSLGKDVTPVMMDDIIVCADPLGCKR